MKVREVIAILEECDGEAELRIMEQPGWALEYEIVGVAVREQFSDRHEPSAGVHANHVFICEGAQLRHGDDAAWDVARRK